MEQKLLQDIATSSPWLVVSLASVAIVLLDVFIRREWSRGGFAGLALIVAILCTGFAFGDLGPGKTLFNGLMYADRFSGLVSFLILAGSAVVVLFSFNTVKHEGIETPAEYYALLLMSTSGALIFASAAELITMFLGLEIMSLALYALCGSALGRRDSAESSLKYFLLGSFSSAFFLYGIALLYGLSGSTEISEVASALARLDSPATTIAIGMVLIGVIFKIGGFPFHFWAPDVYQGAPTPVTAYMACVIKLAAFSVAVRVLWVMFGAQIPAWAGAMWAVAVLTMTVGNLAAIRQTSMKRLLAYSSVAHAGYLFVAMLLPGGDGSGGAALLYYLVAYSLMTLGAFGVLLLVSAEHSDAEAPDDISHFRGLGFRRPILGLAMSFFLFALAGLPPGIAGFVGKFYIFSAAVRADYIGLTLIGVINSAISCYYYLKIIVAMYFHDEVAPSVSSESQGAVAVPVADFSIYAMLAIAFAGLMLFGLVPSVLYDGMHLVMSPYNSSF